MYLPYGLHMSVYAGYPEPLPVEERVLYRLDEHPTSGTPMVLVQSQGEPDWVPLESEAGYLLCAAQCKAIDLQPREGDRYAFRLRANPTVKKATHEREPETREGYVAIARAARERGQRLPGSNGIRLGLTREDDQRAWLARQGERHGFSLERLDVFAEGLQRATRSDGGRMSHLAVRYEGLLRVTDAAGLTVALREGIGSAKAFGYGLLSLAPAAG
jgi:CRISPR system Cascade subunit CasE